MKILCAINILFLTSGVLSADIPGSTIRETGVYKYVIQICTDEDYGFGMTRVENSIKVFDLHILEDGLEIK